MANKARMISLFPAGEGCLGCGWILSPDDPARACLDNFEAEIHFNACVEKWYWLKIALQQGTANPEKHLRLSALINGNHLPVRWSVSIVEMTYTSWLIPSGILRAENNKLVLKCADFQKKIAYLRLASLESIPAGEIHEISVPMGSDKSEERKGVFLLGGESVSFKLDSGPCTGITLGYSRAFPSVSFSWFLETLDFLISSLPAFPTFSPGLALAILFSSMLEFEIKESCSSRVISKFSLIPGLSPAWRDIVIDFSGSNVELLVKGKKDLAAATNQCSVFVSEPASLKSLGCAKNEIKRKNVILISLDTVRADHLSSYGYVRKTSPCLDDMAKEGVLFKEAISPASWTLPAHMSLFTGLYSSRFLPWADNRTFSLGSYRDGLISSGHTLARLFRANGYITVAFTGNSAVDSLLGFSDGFMRYLNISTLHPDKTKEIFERGFAWLRQFSSRSNFFLFLHTYEAHQPHLHRYFAEKGRDAGRLACYSELSQVPLEFVPTEGEKQFAIDVYDSSLLHVDRYLGMLLEVLEKLKLLDDTILIVCSDHGEDIWDHTWWGHGEMYQEILHVPLVFYNIDPQRRGLIIETPVSLLDILPTIVEKLSLRHGPFQVMDGISLLPLLEGNEVDRPAIFSECVIGSGSPHVIACFNERYKYIQERDIFRFPVSSTLVDEKIFNLQDDRLETNNLSGEMPDKVSLFRAACQDLLFDISRSRFLASKTKEYSPSEELQLVQRLKALGYL